MSTTAGELRETVDQLKKAIDVSRETIRQSRSWPDIEPLSAMDNNGRFILLDAYAALAHGLATLMIVEDQR